jgi:alpha-glucosidase
MLLTLRGTPFMYYGEELGMRDGVIPLERVCDPVGKRFPAVGRDPCRTPMHWDRSQRAGFTTASDAWLPLAAEYDQLNVAVESDDPRSVLSFYRRLIWYRKRTPALTHGSYRALDSANDTFVYLREHAGERRLIALNFAPEARTVTLPFASGRVELSTDPDRALGTVTLASFTLDACEGVLIEL